MPDGTTVTGPPTAPPQNLGAYVPQQILNSFLQQPVADMIRREYEYLNANSQQYTALMNCVPVVAQAAQLYGSGDLVSAFSMAYSVYRTIALLRLTNPSMPNI